MNRKSLLIIVVFFLFLSLSGCDNKKSEETETVVENEIEDVSLVLGDERFEEYLPLLENKRVALFSNQTGIVGNKTDKTIDNDLIPFGFDENGKEIGYGIHILDALIEKGVNVTSIFSPEHGFRGDKGAGENVDDSYDYKTGIPILSLYSENGHYPSEKDMDSFDVLVVDMEDVGVRFYTYSISLYYLMDACAKYDKQVIILDRPNPNGFYVDGPLLKEGFESGVGILPIPVVYGMSLGELALMINGELWLSNGKNSCDLTVISCLNYDHQMKTSLIKRPSPNLKDMRAVYLYPSLCFFEESYVSVGRGTDHPFEIYGSPYFEGIEDYDYSFIPESMEGAVYPDFEGRTCYGKDLRQLPLEQIIDDHINLSYLIDAYQRFSSAYPDMSFFGDSDNRGYYYIDYLSGSDDLRKMIESGMNEKQIKETWKDDIETFKVLRRPYLLYSE